MKNKAWSLLTAFAALASVNGAFAQTSYDTDNRVVEHNVQDEVIGITPQIGLMSVTNANGASNTRGVVGLGIDLNMAATGNTYFGISTGANYSHLGTSNSNFFGGNSNTGGLDNGSLVMIPADLKLGYNFNQAFRLSAVGGGNVIYRSVASSLNLGSGSNSSSSLWKIYPNAALVGEWQIGRNVLLNVRPDMTFTPGNNLFVATVGATFVGF